VDGYYQNEQRQKIAAARKKNIKGTLIVVALAVVAFFAFQFFTSGRGDIRTVRDTVHQPTNMTFGEILEGYCTRTSWERFTSAEFMSVVEFTGRTRSGDDVIIQFSDRFGLDDGRWNITYMRINGRSASTGEIANWFMNAAHHAR